MHNERSTGRDPRLAHMRNLLKQEVPVDDRCFDWPEVERNVMNQLDRTTYAQKKPVSAFTGFSLTGLFTFLLRNPPAFAGAALSCCLAIGIAGYVFWQHTPSSEQRVSVLGVRGNVFISHGGPGVPSVKAWRRVNKSDNLIPGSMIHAGSDGGISARMSEGTGFAIAAGSRMRIRSADDGLELDQGKISLIVRKRVPGRSFSVSTPNAVCEVLGTAFTVSVTADDAGPPVTQVTVMHGSVKISDRNNPGVYTVARASESVVITGDTVHSPVHIDVPIIAEEIADTILSQQLNSLLAAATAPGTKEIGRYDQQISVSLPTVPLLAVPDLTIDYPKLAAPEAVLSGGSAQVQNGSYPAALDDTGTPADTTKTKADIPVSEKSPVAGRLCGVVLYWENPKRKFDTLGFKAACEAIAPEMPESVRTPSCGKPVMSKNGKRCIRITNFSALDLAILSELGTPVIILSQWSSFIENVRLDHRNNTDQEIIISDLLWEKIESASIRNPQGIKKSDITVQLHFSNAGHADFDARTPLMFKTTQILGTTGFSMEDKYWAYYTKQNINRLIIQAYCIVDARRTISALTKEVEDAMDRNNLNMSYRIPEFAEVK